MCGLVGFFQPDGLPPGAIEDTLKRQMDCLRHRGPDGAGTWADAKAGVALGHRRLAILDLSPTGAQPMVSCSGRYVIVFNGEIYNHLELRERLSHGPGRQAWFGHSDTETLLGGFEAWGIESTLKSTVGMFALAVWDRRDGTLTLARDRMGEKPLYYGWQSGVFLFGSELKALRAHSAFQAALDGGALAAYFTYGFIGAPLSIYQGIHKLPPGTYVQLTRRTDPSVELQPQAYWSLSDVIEAASRDPFEGSDEEAIEALDCRLRQSIRLQRIADVPVGAFLSGGIDSSAVVALMQAQSTRPIATFTIGFHERKYEESQYAKAVAQHLGTAHTELHVTPREAMAVIPRLPSIYDEPFGDSSAIPTFLVAQLARRQVIVCLSGDGGDELFAGYSRYRRTADIWRLMRGVPRPVRRTLAQACEAVSGLDGAGSSLGWRAGRLALYLKAASLQESYQLQLVQHNRPQDVLLPDVATLELRGSADANAKAAADPWMLMMSEDARTYLPDDILVKVDRASMSVSLETRVPMLDHRVLEFAWRLPHRFKVRNGEPKWLLKRLLEKYLPRSLIDRPKMGFGIPLGEWMRGPLREWAEDLLTEDRLRQDGVLCAQTVRRRWARHLAGIPGEGASLWQILMFQSWLQSSREAPSGSPR